MDFDKFMQSSLAARTATVDVPELKAFFGKDAPKWTVRGITAAELARAKEAAEDSGDLTRAAVEALSGSGDKVEALRKLLGVSDKNTPGDISRRIEMLTHGSVSPEIGSGRRDVVVKLSENFPTVFYNLTNQILSLTGEGAELVKRKNSGKAPKSGA